jgi:hypothetical protein
MLWAAAMNSDWSRPPDPSLSMLANSFNWLSRLDDSTSADANLLRGSWGPGEGGYSVRCSQRARCAVRGVCTVCGCAGVRTCGCAGVRVCGCVGVRVCGCAGVRVCGCAGVHGVRVCG